MVIDILSELSEDVTQKIEDEHLKYEALHDINIGYKQFYLIAKEGDHVVGILSAYTAYKEIYIEDLIVFEKYRKQAYGKRLISEIENLFQNKNYNNINLVTNEFQAVGFYEKCGFELEFTRKNNSNPKLNKYYFVKFL